jgi:hypothetical protein
MSSNNPKNSQKSESVPVLTELSNGANRRDFLRYSGIGVGATAAVILGGCARGAKSAKAETKPRRKPAKQVIAKAPPPQKRRFSVKSIDAMQTLKNTIDEINERYFSPAYFFNSAQDVAEGQRYLMNLMSAATEFYLEGNPDNPWFVNMITPARKYLGDNPDAYYFFTQIHGNRYYRITGRREESEYISFTAHTGGHDGNWNGPGLFHINHRDILFNPDGTYEILVGPRRRNAKNWLQTDSKVFHILSRYYYEHRVSAVIDPKINPDVRIEAIDPVPKKPTHMNDREIARGMLAVANFLRVSTLGFPPPTSTTMPEWISSVVNRLGKPIRFGNDQQDIGFGALDNTYTAGRYKLRRHEALVMDGQLPDCFFANVVLWNRFLQTDNYFHNTISLNRRQMKLDRNGRYRIVVSATDPRVPNWLNTCGRETGMIHWRFLLAEGEVKRPVMRVVPALQAAALPVPS